MADALGSFRNNLEVNGPEFSEFYSFLGEEKLNALLTAVKETSEYLAEKQAQLSNGEKLEYKMLPDDATVKLDLDVYKQNLAVHIGVNFDEILSWYEAEVANDGEKGLALAL